MYLGKAAGSDGVCESCMGKQYGLAGFRSCRDGRCLRPECHLYFICVVGSSKSNIDCSQRGDSEASKPRASGNSSVIRAG